MNNNKPEIKDITKDTKAIHLMDGSVYTISSNYKNDDSLSSRLTFTNSWESDPAIVMGKEIVPHGHNNDLPQVIRRVMDRSNIGPGILKRKIGLQYGDGPFLYTEIVDEKNNIIRQPTPDAEINAWLESWSFDRYIDIIVTEFMYMEGFYTRFYRNRTNRLSADQLNDLGSMGITTENKILKLEAVQSSWARLGWPKSPEKRLENVDTIYVGDFENNCFRSGIASYPVWKKQDPFKHAVSMTYHNLYSFCRTFYSIPSYYGTLPWLETASDIPDIFRYLTENGITAAFHIHSPQIYWDNKREQLEKKYEDETDAQILKRLEDIKTELFQRIAETLSGKQNTGKFIQTVDFYDQDGNLCSWKIEAIDQSIKDFIEAQIKISEKADSAATSGMGLAPSLANLVTNGGLSSGSQQLYSMKFHILTEVNKPEKIIFQAINEAIAINWPDKAHIKMGFARKVVMKEDEVAPKNRVTNNV